MGFRITTIENLPKDLRYYIFLLDTPNSLSGCINRHFSSLADKTGKDGAFVIGTGDQYEKELYQRIIPYKENDIISDILKYPSIIICEKNIHEAKEAFILILKTNKHNSCKLAIRTIENIINIIRIEGFKKIKTLMETEHFISNDVLFKYFYNPSKDSRISLMIDKINRYILLRPSFFGIGVNLNNIIKDMKK